VFLLYQHYGLTILERVFLGGFPCPSRESEKCLVVTWKAHVKFCSANMKTACHRFSSEIPLLNLVVWLFISSILVVQCLGSLKKEAHFWVRAEPREADLSCSWREGLIYLVKLCPLQYLTNYLTIARRVVTAVDVLASQASFSIWRKSRVWLSSCQLRQNRRLHLRSLALHSPAPPRCNLFIFQSSNVSGVNASL